MRMVTFPTLSLIIIQVYHNNTQFVTLYDSEQHILLDDDGD